LFVTIGDANVVVTDVNTLVEGWQEINISLPDIAAAGVDLNNVSYMEIGLGDGTDLGMSSSKWDVLYIDNIRKAHCWQISQKTALLTMTTLTYLR